MSSPCLVRWVSETKRGGLLFSYPVAHLQYSMSPSLRLVYRPRTGCQVNLFQAKKKERSPRHECWRQIAEFPHWQIHSPHSCLHRDCTCLVQHQETKLRFTLCPDILKTSDTAKQTADQFSSHLLTPHDDMAWLWLIHKVCVCVCECDAGSNIHICSHPRSCVKTDPDSVGNYTRLSGLWAKTSHEEDECGLHPSLSFGLDPLPPVCASFPPCFYFSVHLLCLFGSVQQLPLLQSRRCRFPPPTLFSPRAPFSFIHSYFTAAQSSHRAWALSHYNLPHSPSICVPLVFLPLGILLLSLPLSPCTPPLCWCLPVSSFFLFALVCLIALPLLLPNSTSLVSLCLSLLLVSFRFPLQSLVMRCDKPCYHSNGFPWQPISSVGWNDRSSPKHLQLP